MEYDITYYTKEKGKVRKHTTKIGPSYYQVERFIETIENLFFGVVTRENEAGEDVLVSEFFPRD